MTDLFLLRPFTLEYRVSDRLDGVAPAPAYPVPPSPDAPVGTAQKLIFNVERLGLIDLTGRVGNVGGFAGRVVNALTLYGPSVPVTADNVGVAFNGIIQRTEIDIDPAANGVFSRSCIFIPQTAQLLVDGMNATPGNPVVVRVSIWQPNTQAELTAMLKSCCCVQDCVTSAGAPCFERAIVPLI